ncbi:MAG: hypothetical protein ACYTKD_10255 [Planctomycetota bacterium]|jgi:hypothetical protein
MGRDTTDDGLSAGERRGCLHFSVAGPGDEAELRALLRDNPLPGKISLSLEREPDFFLGSGVFGDVSRTFVARDAAGGPILGFGSRSVRSMYVDGEVRQLGYLSQLRVIKQRRWSIKGLIAGYRFAASMRAEGELPYDITTVMDGNDMAKRLFTSGIRGMPFYREAGGMATFTIDPGSGSARRPADGLELAGGADVGLDTVAALLERCYRRHSIAPHWTAEDLASGTRTRGLEPGDFVVAVRGGEPVGCLACWDQRGFKQVVVHGYSSRLKALRPLARLLGRFLGTPELPKIGAALRQCFASHIAVVDDDPFVLRSLLDEACRRSRRLGITHLTFGLGEGHPSAEMVARTYRPIVSRSVIYTVHWDGVPAAAPANGAIPHLEVAVL